MNIKHKFIQFLKDNNAYEEFINNLQVSLDKYLNYFSINDSTNFIANAFLWYSTEEGTYFWEYLNEKWRITLFKLLLPYLIRILKKNNLYGYWIINAYKEGNNLKKQLIPYDYLYRLFKNTEIIDTFNYNNAIGEWAKIISLNKL